METTEPMKLGIYGPEGFPSAVSAKSVPQAIEKPSIHELDPRAARRPPGLARRAISLELVTCRLIKLNIHQLFSHDAHRRWDCTCTYDSRAGRLRKGRSVCKGQHAPMTKLETPVLGSVVSRIEVNDQKVRIIGDKATLGERECRPPDPDGKCSWFC